MKTSNRIILFCLILLYGSCFVSYEIDLDTVKQSKELLDQYPEITNLNRSSCARRVINEVAICGLHDRPCQKEEEHYRSVLEKWNIEENIFMKLSKHLEDSGIASYYRTDSVSLFVVSGGFGDIRGVMVYDDDVQELGQPFRLNNHYFVEVGKEIEPRIYYFRG